MLTLFLVNRGVIEKYQYITVFLCDFPPVFLFIYVGIPETFSSFRKSKEDSSQIAWVHLCLTPLMTYVCLDNLIQLSDSSVVNGHNFCIYLFK